MADMSIEPNPTENDSDGGVINPIGPLDSSNEPDEADHGKIQVEHSADANIDHDFACNGSDGVADDIPPISETSSQIQSDDDTRSLCNKCYGCLCTVKRGVRCECSMFF